MSYEYAQDELQEFKLDTLNRIAKKYGLQEKNNRRILINNILNHQDLLSEKLEANKKKSPAKESTPKNVEPYRDWTKVAIIKSDNLYDYWVVPKNTLLYKGVAAKFEDDKLPALPSFYADLNIASIYAFDNDTKSRFGEYGKVITVITKKDIELLDLSSKKTLASLEKLKQKNINIQATFGTPIEPKRISSYSADEKISKWLCENNFSGFGYPKYAGFHNEIMICSNDFIDRYNIEYRSINGLQCLFEISFDKGLLRVIPAKLAPYTENIRQISHYGIYRPEDIRKIDKYIPEIRKDSKILCEPVASQYDKLLFETRKAVLSNDLKNLKKGIDEGAPPGNLIHTAINNRKIVNDDTIKFLIEEGANPNFLKDLVDLDKDMIKFAINQGSQPSIFIDKVKTSELLNLLLDSGGNQTEIGMKAVNIKDYDLVKKSLDKGANAYNILDRSLSNEYYEGAELAMKYNPQYISTLLSRYISEGTRKQLLFLLDYGVDPTAAISSAIHYDDTKLIKLLVDKGIDYSFLKDITVFTLKPKLIFLLEYAGNKIPKSDLLQFRTNLIEIKQRYGHETLIDKLINEIDKLLEK